MWKITTWASGIKEIVEGIDTKWMNEIVKAAVIYKHRIEVEYIGE